MGLLDDYQNISGLLNQQLTDYYDNYKQWGQKNKEYMQETPGLRQMDQVGDVIQNVMETPGVDAMMPMTAFIKNNPRLLQATFNEARSADEAVRSKIVDWLLGKSGRPAAPSEVYRGIPKGVEPINNAGYTHATPWQYEAGRAGKGGFGDFRANDIYKYDTDAATKYYRGGSLAGDPLESTKINSAGGMTWDEILDQAKALHKQELQRINQQYLNDPMREQLALDEWSAKKVANAVKNASFETDIGNKPGIWSGRDIPPALGKERPILRSNDELRKILSKMKALGVSEDEIVNLPEYKILNKNY